MKKSICVAGGGGGWVPTIKSVEYAYTFGRSIIVRRKNSSLIKYVENCRLSNE